MDSQLSLTLTTIPWPAVRLSWLEYEILERCSGLLVVYNALSRLPLIFLARYIGSQSYKSEAATSTTLSVTSTCSIGKFSMVTTSQIWSGHPLENLLLVFMS